MLSDEEKKALKEVKHFNQLTRYWQEEEYEEKEIAGYIETILNLIEKQPKEIEELKNADLTTVYMNGFYDGEKKVEDKIKAKIEEAKKNYNDLHTKHLRDCGIAEQRELAKIEFGQSLLEKE